MRRATHVGECQVCGRVQKLPNMLLSKHGYTKRWGWFMGTCPGAEHVPLEVGKELIEGAIASALATAKMIRAQIRELRAITDGSKVWYSRYYSWNDKNAPLDMHRRGGSVYERGHLISETIPYADGTGSYQRVYWIADRDGTKHDLSHSTSINEQSTRQNGYYIDFKLEPHLKQLLQYVEWQRERIANWTPKKLTPVDVV